ncbi:hypothetical protein D3C72_1114660 [compost metagenome]
MADRLDHAEEATRRTGLPGRELAAAGVVRKAAVEGHGVGLHEGRALALLAEAQVLELHHHDDGVVVVGLHEVERGGLHAGLCIEVVAVLAPAALHHHRVFGVGVVALDGAADHDVRQAQVACALLAHHEEGVGAGAGHHAVEQVDRVGDGPRGHVLVEREALLEHGVGVAQRVGALVDADATEVFARGTVGAHVVGGDEREDRVRAARAVGVARIAREVAEAAQRLAEGVDVVGVGAHAGDDVGIARLHGTRGAAQAHHARGTAGGHVVEPARRQAQVLRDAHGRVGREREAAQAQPVDLFLGHAAGLHQRVDGLADEPVRGARGVAHVGHGDGHRDRDAFVGKPVAFRHACLFFMERVSMQWPWPGSDCAISRSWPRWIFCEGVSGSASTKAT